MLNGKNILITGGTGSFGKAFTRYLLRHYSPNKIIIFSRDELKQYQMAKLFSKEEYPAIRYFLGDIRDESRLLHAFRDVDFVIHAAALKHVPTAEYNPFEYIKTNIIGSQHIINAAIERGVKKVIALSTDKACNPINLYGATKLCSDKLMVAANSMSGANGTNFAVVRYGNVLGSRGSVIPFFLERKGEPELPITDERMTRFWITLDSAVQLVINALDVSKGGEIFVPKIPSMMITDLAKAISPGSKLKKIGIRPGEKIHESMISEYDAENTLEYDSYYVIYPSSIPVSVQRRIEGGKSVPNGFTYSSDSNPEKLDGNQLISLLEKYDLKSSELTLKEHT